MKRAFMKSPQKSCKELKIEHPQLFGDVKVRTMQDHLCRRLGFVSRVARPKPVLTDRHKKLRLAFAQRTKNWSREDWRKVVWSDESRFKVCEMLPKKVRRPHYKKGSNYGNPFDSKYLMATKKFDQSIMIWGCMSGNAGRGSLVVIPKGQTVTAKSYLDILKEKLKDVMDIHGADYFMQDGAPPHTAKIVKNWLSTNNIQVLEWPPQSPDLNPIENLWHYMKQQLENYDTSSLAKLEIALRELWCKGLQLDTFIKYANSMPERIQAVIQAGGGTTKY